MRGSCFAEILIHGNMRISSKLHSRPIILKAILGQINFLLNKFTYDSDELIVLNYHSTPKKFIDNFEKQTLFFKKHFDIINPECLTDYYNGKLTSKKPKLLLTFDDGLKNNLYAAEVLYKHGIKAIFFLIPDFVDSDVTSQKGYYLKHIRPIINPNIDFESEDFEAIGWADLSELVSQGHCMGSHSKSHTMVADKLTESQLTEEIVESGLTIEKKLGIKVNSFCSINNTLLSIGAREKLLINQHYEFHFTTIPGSNMIQKSKQFIKRRNVECFWPDGAMLFAVGKQDLRRWQSKIKQYEVL